MSNFANFITKALPGLHFATIEVLLPLSFRYGEKTAAEILAEWQCREEEKSCADGRTINTFYFTDAKTGLELRCIFTSFPDFPALEWIIYFCNTGMADTPIISQIRPLDLSLQLPDKVVTIHHAKGSECAEDDFIPRKNILVGNGEFTIAPYSGRSSQGALPYFNIEWTGGGVSGAIGWSGQWEMKTTLDEEQKLHLQAGQQTTHFLLHPGEEVRSPRMLLINWQGDDKMLGHNLLRQIQLAYYSPRVNGVLPIPPITQNTWFEYDTGNGVTEENQLAAMPIMQAGGIEGYWLDAGWFEGGWPDGAGSWVPRSDAFPNGLKPMSEEAHRRGMKFVLWFEPERVTPNSIIAKEHPEWVMHHPSEHSWGAHYNLGIPEACEYITDFIDKCITDWGIDVFRNDYNIDPLLFWQHQDSPDRVGIAEIRYLEGLYRFWDTLRERHPNLTIDNCASGGRRIDLETNLRSYPLWRSDTQCYAKAIPIGDQVQSAGLSLYVPLHAAGLWSTDLYEARSVVTTGFSNCISSNSPSYDVSAMKLISDEVQSLRPFYLGDYYPLLHINIDPHHWCAWQYHRADMNAGFVTFFRRGEAPYSTVTVSLRGLEADKQYCFTCNDNNSKFTSLGADVMRAFTVRLDEKAKSLLFRYQLLAE